MGMQTSKFSSLKQGETIFSEGDLGTKIYIIKSGTVHIQVRKENKVITLATLTSGNCFGEMSVINHITRTASAVAKTDVEVYEVNKTIVDQMIEDLPSLLKAIVTSLIKRVQGMNEFANEKISMAHPLSSMAHLISLLGDATSFASMSPPSESNALTIVSLKEIIKKSHVVFGYNDNMTLTILKKLILFKVVVIEGHGNQRTLTFQPEGFTQKVEDIIQSLGESSYVGLKSELEYVDLRELAQHLKIDAHQLIDSITSGEIPKEAIILRNTLVQQAFHERRHPTF